MRNAVFKIYRSTNMHKILGVIYYYARKDNYKATTKNLVNTLMTYNNRFFNSLFNTAILCFYLLLLL